MRHAWGFRVRLRIETDDVDEWARLRPEYQAVVILSRFLALKLGWQLWPEQMSPTVDQEGLRSLRAVAVLARVQSAPARAAAIVGDRRAIRPPDPRSPGGIGKLNQATA